MSTKKAMKKTSFGFCPKCGEPLALAGFTTNPTPKQRYKCVHRHSTTRPLKEPQSNVVSMRMKLPNAKVYIITAAQNATPVHGPFWKSIEHCKKFYGAELAVIPGRHKNPTSQWTVGNDKHEWWDALVLPYLCKG